MEEYKKFCRDCIDGKIHHKEDFHILKKLDIRDDKDNNQAKMDITIVSPTKAAVEQAKSELVHDINTEKNQDFIQMHGKGRRRKKVKKIIKKKKGRLNKKIKKKKDNLKKKKTKKKKIIKKKKTTYKSLWK